MNERQLDMDFKESGLPVSMVHLHENNAESEGFLQDNHKRFHRQCRLLIQKMMEGEVFTSETATFKYHIMAPIRRFNDIVNSGLPVRYEWDANNMFKELSIPVDKRQEVKEVWGKYFL